MDEFMEKRLKELNEARERIAQGGGEEKIAKQRAKGKLLARERLDELLDPDSFFETGPLIGHLGGTPTDGIVTGTGTIDGRKVMVYSQDPTVRGGSVGFHHGIKLYRTIEMAIEMRIPLIGLNDSPGARTPKGTGPDGAVSRLFSKKDGEDSQETKSKPGFETGPLGNEFAGMGMFAILSEKHGGSVFAPNTYASGVIPQISAILGTCAGIGVYSPALMDFIFMVDKSSHMFITGPGIVKMTIGEDVNHEELGGSKVHASKSGVIDGRFQDEKLCLSEIRRLMSFLPSYFEEDSPVVRTGDDPGRSCAELMDMVPSDGSKPYDMGEVIKVIIDNGDFLELKKEFSSEVITGFARLDGRTVGIVANQPKVKAGSLTVDSSCKQARFIRFCDCFNIPLLLLVDTPAYMPGTEQEHSGIIRHGAKVLYALCEATVPRITLVLRKTYGGGNLGMGVLPGLQTDMVLNWPIMESGILGAKQTVQMFTGGMDLTKEQFDSLLEGFRNFFANPIRDASANCNLSDVITPAETRQYLIRSFEMLRGKKRVRIRKKHGNIPL